MSLMPRRLIMLRYATLIRAAAPCRLPPRHFHGFFVALDIAADFRRRHRLFFRRHTTNILMPAAYIVYRR